ncbi:MAG: thiamine pyrophosphate-dependent enzyme [Candidatus Njordarchaeum guaymaensis]
MASLNTYAVNTWCPGCGNFAILRAIKAVLQSFEKEGESLNKFVMITGIGCHGKIADYVNINSFYTIHGRVTSTATGIKLGNPELKVIGFAGDGDAYGEGLAHLIFAAKRNIDITMIIHNNRVYGLTTGQFTPTSPFGFKGKSTPFGSLEKPFNPLELMFSARATFIARGYSTALNNLIYIIKEAIKHKGFALVDVLQPCFTFFNTYSYYNQRVYELKDHDPSSREEALKHIKEWDYDSDSKIPIGIFYKEEKPTFDDLILSGIIPAKRKRDINIKEILRKTI